VFHEFLWGVLTVQDREVREDATVRVVETQALSFKKKKKRKQEQVEEKCQIRKFTREKKDRKKLFVN
jgi:hypothetical protein